MKSNARAETHENDRESGEIDEPRWAEVTRGIGRIVEDYRVAVAFGVLTTDTVEQALDRAGARHGNKGYEAAVTAVEMARLARMLG